MFLAAAISGMQKELSALVALEAKARWVDRKPALQGPEKAKRERDDITREAMNLSGDIASAAMLVAHAAIIERRILRKAPRKIR